MIKKVITFGFVVVLTGFLMMNILMEDLTLSISERRPLKAFPEFGIQQLFSGEFMTSFEKYALDQFAFRETFRKLRANFDYSILGKKDVNDLLIYEDHLIQLEYPYDEKSGANFVNYINKITALYLEDSQVYLSIIPDKAYFLEAGLYPQIDYLALQQQITNNMENIKYISLFDKLTLEDYYKTDSHWRQEKLIPIVELLGEIMGFDTDFHKIDYQAYVIEDFKGVYYGQAALTNEVDQLHYLVSDAMTSVEIINYQYLKDENLQVYDLSKLDSLDLYDIYLSGASPLIEITNLEGEKNKEIIIFRDSYGSSMAPLLLDEYSKITLVDTRYMSFELLEEYIEFEGQDVLFLYSVMVINNSQMLK